MATSKLAGAWGEAVAAEFLRKKRYKIVASGYYSRFGEIDLIVQNRKYLVFVEVKTRKSPKFAQAREFVDTKSRINCVSRHPFIFLKIQQICSRDLI